MMARWSFFTIVVDMLSFDFYFAAMVQILEENSYNDVCGKSWFVAILIRHINTPSYFHNDDDKGNRETTIYFFR